MHLHARFGLIVAAIVALLPGLVAGQSPTSTPTAGIVTTMRISAPVEFGAQAARSVSFSRQAIGSGETVNIDGGTDSTAVVFGQGSWSVTPNGPVALYSPSGDSPAAPVAQMSTSASAGDLAVISANISLTVKNTGTLGAEVVVATFQANVPAATATPVVGTPKFADPRPLPQGPLAVTVSLVAIGANQALPTSTLAGPKFIEVQTGAVVIVLNPGQVRVQRDVGGEEFVQTGFFDAAAQPTLDPNDSEQKEEIEARAASSATPMIGSKIGLGAGDAGLIDGGSVETIRGSADEPAVVLMLDIAATSAGTSTASTPTP